MSVKQITWVTTTLALVVGLGATAAWWRYRAASSRDLADTAPLTLRGKPISPPRSEIPAAPSHLQPGSTSSPISVAVAAAPVASAAASPGASPITSDGYQSVTFEKLASFSYQMPPEPLPTNQSALALLSTNQIPPPIKAFDSQPVSLRGFMLPLKVERGLVTEMLIMRDQSMCCFGVVPKINEWVSVKMATKGVKPIMDQPVTMQGKLRVGEVYENGYLVGIYAMDGDQLATPLDR